MTTLFILKSNEITKQSMSTNRLKIKCYLQRHLRSTFMTRKADKLTLNIPRNSIRIVRTVYYIPMHVRELY